LTQVFNTAIGSRVVQNRLYPNAGAVFGDVKKNPPRFALKNLVE
jgi:hypothetical protein